MFERAKEFIDENTDVRGILIILTDEKGNIRTISNNISPFEKIGIGEFMQQQAKRSIIYRPLDNGKKEETTTSFVT